MRESSFMFKMAAFSVIYFTRSKFVNPFSAKQKKSLFNSLLSLEILFKSVFSVSSVFYTSTHGFIPCGV